MCNKFIINYTYIAFEIIMLTVKCIVKNEVYTFKSTHKFLIFFHGNINLIIWVKNTKFKPLIIRYIIA